MKINLYENGHITFTDEPRKPKDWKIYFIENGMPCFRGGYGEKEDGKPNYITYHPATNYPHWDWVELEDETWLWIRNPLDGGLNKEIND